VIGSAGGRSPCIQKLSTDARIRVGRRHRQPALKAALAQVGPLGPELHDHDRTYGWPPRPGGAAPRVIIAVSTPREHVMERHSSLLILASGSHGGALVFTIGVGVVLLIAIYALAKRRR
jgi:hypothetical protein